MDSNEVVGGCGEGAEDDGGNERGVSDDRVLKRCGRERVWRR